MPFFVVGSISLILGVCLCLVIPDIECNPIEEFNNNAKDGKEKKNRENLSFLTIIKVIIASLELSLEATSLIRFLLPAKFFDI